MSQSMSENVDVKVFCKQTSNSNVAKGVNITELTLIIELKFN